MIDLCRNYYSFFLRSRDEITCVRSDISGLTSDLSSPMKDVRTLVISGVSEGGDWGDWLEVTCAYVLGELDML